MARQPFVGKSIHDAARSKTFVYVHGYNVSPQDAEYSFGTVFRRVFWQGFRGNFVGFEWYGNKQAPLFTPNIDTALHSSGSLWLFLRNTLELSREDGGWGMNPENIDIAAHSLGNLVMWDAIRLNGQITGGHEKLVHNVTSIEAAIWSETFDPPANVTILDGEPATYTPAILETNSWQHYFNPSDISIRSSIDGQIANSYFSLDEPLQFWMRLNDFNNLGDHLTRATVPFRTASNLAHIPSLLPSGHRHADYTADDVGVAAGVVPIPIADRNIDASLDGWDNSDGFNAANVFTGDNAHSDHVVEPYSKIYGWWKNVFAGNGNAGARAIALGKE